MKVCVWTVKVKETSAKEQGKKRHSSSHFSLRGRDETTSSSSAEKLLWREFTLGVLFLNQMSLQSVYGYCLCCCLSVTWMTEEWVKPATRPTRHPTVLDRPFLQNALQKERRTNFSLPSSSRASRLKEWNKEWEDRHATHPYWFLLLSVMSLGLMLIARFNCCSLNCCLLVVVLFLLPPERTKYSRHSSSLFSTTTAVEEKAMQSKVVYDDEGDAQAKARLTSLCFFSSFLSLLLLVLLKSQ